MKTFFCFKNWQNYNFKKLFYNSFGRYWLHIPVKHQLQRLYIYIMCLWKAIAIECKKYTQRSKLVRRLFQAWSVIFIHLIVVTIKVNKFYWLLCTCELAVKQDSLAHWLLHTTNNVYVCILKMVPNAQANFEQMLVYKRLLRVDLEQEVNVIY